MGQKELGNYKHSVYHKALSWDVGEAYLPMSNIPYPHVGDLSYFKKKTAKAFLVLSFKTQQEHLISLTAEPEI